MAEDGGAIRYDNGLDLTFDYLKGAEDIPLPSGLAEDESAMVVYDKPSGRIVQEVAYGPINIRRVDEFYKDTLPQLGWIEVGLHQYIRKDEHLTIELEGDHEEAMVRFTIVPAVEKPRKTP